MPPSPKCSARLKINDEEAMCPIRDYCYRFISLPVLQGQNWITPPGHFVKNVKKERSGGWHCSAFEFATVKERITEWSGKADAKHQKK